MRHDDVIETITSTLIDIPQIRALFLSGSYATGVADAYSDIDFVMVASNGATDETSEIWRNAVRKTGNIVLWWDRLNVPVLINAITQDWTRTDVVILRPDQMGAQTQSSLKPLFDHDNLFDDLAEVPKAVGPNLPKFKYQIEEFIRILGLLHLAAGREEYINGVLGIFHLRNLLVDLLIEETNAPNRGGVLHLNRLITTDQQALITSLPPAIPNRESMISAHLAYAKMYLPRARARAKKLGLDWPEHFEDATWERLGESMSIQRPYDPK